MQDDFDIEYEASTARLHPLGIKLEGLIGDLLKTEDIRYHSVKFRVKKKDSCVRKLQRSDTERSLSSLTDVLGVRIVTYFRDDVDAASKVIEREFAIDAGNSVDKSAILDPDRFGYLSVHYISQLGLSRADLPENRVYKGAKFEIQIRSITQHAWAEIEHDLGYKSEAAIPKAVRRRFSRLAGLLELADDEFVAIREELAAHRAISTTAIGEGDLNVEIDQDSLYSFVDSDPRVKALDLFIADAIEHRYIDHATRQYTGARVPQLLSVGFRTIDELSKYLDSDKDLLQEFSMEWAAFTKGARKKALGESPQRDPTVPRGLTLYYVYLLRSAQLSLSGELSAEADAGVGGNRAVLERTLRKLGRDA